MRKIRLFTALLVLPISVFAYDILQDAVAVGDKLASSTNYELWGTFGELSVGKITSSSYTLYGGLIPPDTTKTGAEESTVQIPKVFSLSQNYPNPVISGIHIEYALPKATRITLTVYDATGRTVRILLAGNQEAGYYTVKWDGTDDSGKEVSAGIYFYRMEAGKFKATKKLTILK